MNTQDVENLLGLYAEIVEDRQALAKQLEEMKAAQIPENVSRALDALDEEFKPLIEKAESNLAAVTDQIKTAIKELGQTVKGQHFQAVYMGGKVAWNDDMLKGFAAIHPEIMSMRRTGDPSCQIRKVG